MRGLHQAAASTLHRHCFHTHLFPQRAPPQHHHLIHQGARPSLFSARAPLRHHHTQALHQRHTHSVGLHTTQSLRQCHTLSVSPRTTLSLRHHHTLSLSVVAQTTRSLRQRHIRCAVQGSTHSFSQPSLSLPRGAPLRLHQAGPSPPSLPSPPPLHVRAGTSASTARKGLVLLPSRHSLTATGQPRLEHPCQWGPVDRLACHVSLSGLSTLHVSLPHSSPSPSLDSHAPAPFPRAQAGALWKGPLSRRINTCNSCSKGIHSGTSSMDVEEGRPGQGSGGALRDSGAGGSGVEVSLPPEADSALPAAAAPAAAAQESADAAAATGAGAAAPSAAAAAPGSSWPVQSSVALSPTEEEIFATLLGTVAMFGLNTVLRVAGGWVRDKLLGKDSFDIDIALDDTLGREFAEHVNRFLESKGQTARGVGVIRSNPEQSKHLETATMMVHGQWIDLVNLRAESYADEGSRIPSQIEFGTAKQDALRRDLTINSLFYNINAKTVEDFTGQGLEDLKNGIIRTPLPPMQTFLDDPLRVLRSVRFAARFGFAVSQDLLSAASTDEVRVALGSKVSRERVGKEVELMLKGRDPLFAVELLHTLGLFDTVFTLPQPSAEAGQSAKGAKESNVESKAGGAAKGEGDASGVLLTGLPPRHGQQGVVALASAKRLMGCFLDPSTAGDEMLVATRLAAALLPLRDCTFPDRKKNPVPVTQHIVRESLKLKASLAETVVSLHQHASAFQALVPLLSPTAPGPGAEPNTVTGPGTGGQVGPTWAHLPRVQAGKLLRKAKGSWRSALLLCAVMGDPQGPPRTPPLASTNGANADSPAPAPAPALGTQEGTGIGEHTQGKGQGQGGVDGEGAVQGAGVGLVSKKRVKLGSPGHASGTPLSDWELRCVGAADSIVAMGLEGVWDLKPLLNGREVISCLGLGKGSRETGVWVDRATEWQLAHPQGTPEECRAWLVEAQGSNDGKVRG